MDIPTRINEYTEEQEQGLSNGIDWKIRSYADTLRGTNNIDDPQGVNSICDMFGYTSILMEIY